MANRLVCKKCGKRLTEDTCLSDRHGAYYCAPCYLIMIPSHSGSEPDPQLTRAYAMVRDNEEEGNT